MPCAIVAFLFILSHFLMFWPNGSNSIQTLWSLSSSMYHGPYQKGLNYSYLHVYAVDAEPRSEQKTTIVMPSFDHQPWRCSHACEAHWRPLSIDSWCGLHGDPSALSLSVEEGICLPLAVWQESWPNFKGLPKVSEVATNYWVFLRCDWSPFFS